MQLFILDKDPEICAQMLCDVHIRKMCLETAQILSGIISLQQKKPYPAMPRPYSLFHPVIQALNTPFKVNWVLDLNIFLHKEYLFRFAKLHCYSYWATSYKKILFAPASQENWDFARAFKDFRTDTIDIVDAYREYYRFKKSIIRHWNYTGRPEPEWLN